MWKLAWVVVLCSGCDFEDEGYPVLLSSVVCNPMSLSAEPYHVDCTVKVDDGDADTSEVRFSVRSPDNQTVASGKQDIPEPLPKHATVILSFDLPTPVVAGNYTAEVTAIDGAGNGASFLRSVAVQ